MKKLVFFSMMFLASIVSHAQTPTSYGGSFPGTDAGLMGGNESSFFGTEAGLNSIEQRATFIGFQAGMDSESNDGNPNIIGDNTFVGAHAGQNNIGRNNTFMGANAGTNSQNNTGINTFVGTNTGQNNTGFRNTFIGGFAGEDNTGGRENTFVGAAAGGDNVGGRWNVFVGAAAGRSSNGVIAHNNTYIGYQAGLSNLEGAGNIFIGNQAGRNEMGSNRLYIHNNDDPDPLIEGTFNTRRLTFNGTVGVGDDVPTGTDIQLYLDGRFSQLQQGTLGGFTHNDRWSSLGNSPANEVYGMINQGYGATFVSGAKEDADTGIPNNIIGWSGDRLDFDIIGQQGALTTVMSITRNVDNEGEVVIGDPDVVQTPDGYRLYVEEGILTERVKVAVVNSADWSDYVFEENYDRNTTEEVEQFIQANKHLPNVPSAKEVSENGIDVAKMDATLLRQIEELWLHVIDLKKENETLKNELGNLQK